MRRGTMRGAGCGVLACAVAVAVAGCAGDSGAAEPWDEPDAYTYDATITVFGPAQGEWRVSVRSQDVVEVIPLDEDARYSADVHGAVADDFQTFAEYEAWHAGATDVAVNRLSRDAEGALRRFEYDGSQDVSDDEYLIVVSAVSVP